jgi:hypothetical protein
LILREDKNLISKKEEQGINILLLIIFDNRLAGLLEAEDRVYE